MEVVVYDVERMIFKLEDTYYLIAEVGDRYVVACYIYKEDGNTSVIKTSVVTAIGRLQICSEICNGTFEWFHYIFDRKYRLVLREVLSKFQSDK